MFTLPNAAFAGDPQAGLDSVDIMTMVQGIAGNGVVNGCAVTAQGIPDMTVAVASGTVQNGGVTIGVTSGNVTVSANSTGNTRFDLVVVSNTGTKSVLAGTASTNPVFPTPPTTSTVLAAVMVPAGTSSITSARIVDKRVTVNTTGGGGGGGGPAVTPTGGGKEIVQTISAATGTVNIDLANANIFNVTLTGNVTYVFTGATAGVGCSFVIIAKQNGAGGWTQTFPASVKWEAPPYFTTSANAVAKMGFLTIDGGTTHYGDLHGNNYL